MAAWVLWIAVAGVLGVAELHTLTLVLGMFALAALPAAVVSGLGAGPATQVLTFAVAGVVLLVGVRPIARQHRRRPTLRTGAEALLGRRAVAVTAVSARDGQVRIGGEVWSARLYDESAPVPAGDDVDVVAIDGATALVLPTGPPNLSA
jgi:membrane protein implicated in regulation of membrane protease activity